MEEREMELEERAVRAGAGYTVGNYVIKGLAFLAVPVFTRLMSTAEFGTFGTFSALESILYLPAGLALHTPQMDMDLAELSQMDLAELSQMDLAEPPQMEAAKAGTICMCQKRCGSFF